MKQFLQNSIKFILGITILLISITGIKAQIVYTDLNPDSILNIVNSGDGERIPIDFNGDGTAEFKFRYDKFGSTAIYLHIYRGNNGPSPQVMLKGSATNSSGVPWAEPLTNDADISSTKNWGYSVYGPLLGDPEDLNFLNIGDRYIGVKVNISGHIHYGWILVSYTTLKLTVKGFAYESTPNKAIKTGDKGNVGICVKQEETSFTIYPNPAKKKFSINLKNIVNITNIKIINVLGSEVMKISMLNDNLRNIDISGLKKGIYFVQMITDDKIVISKKLLIE